MLEGRKRWQEAQWVRVSVNWILASSEQRNVHFVSNIMSNYILLALPFPDQWSYWSLKGNEWANDQR